MYRAIEGINAVVVGIMFAASFYMMKDISLIGFNTVDLINISIIVITTLLLLFTRLPAPLIVVVCLLFGWIL